MKKIVLAFSLSFIFIASNRLDASSFISNCADFIRKIGSLTAWADLGKTDINEWRSIYREAQNKNLVAWGALSLTKMMLLNSNELALSKSEIKSLKKMAKILQTSIALPKKENIGRTAATLGRDTLWAMGPFFLRPFVGLPAIPIALDFPSLNRLGPLGLDQNSFFFDSYQFLTNRSRWRKHSLSIMAQNFIRPALVASLLTLSGMGPLDRLDAYNREEIQTKYSSRHYLNMTILDLLKTVQNDSNAFTPERKPIFFVEKNLVKDSPNLKKLGTVVTDPLNGIAELAVLESKYGIVEKESFSSFQELGELFKKHSENRTIVVMYHGLSSILTSDNIPVRTYGEGISNDELLSNEITKFKNQVLANDTILVIVSCHAADRGYTEKIPLAEPWVLWSYWTAGFNKVKIYAPINLVSYHTVNIDETPETAWNRILKEDPYAAESYIHSLRAEEVGRLRFVDLMATVVAKGIGLAYPYSVILHRMNNEIPDEVKSLGLRVLDTKAETIRHLPLDGPPLPDQRVFNKSIPK